MTVNSEVKLSTGRIAKVSARTFNTCTGFIVWFTKSEAKSLKLIGYSNKKYSFSVDMNGNVERWINGYGGVITKIAAPVLI